MGLLYRGVSAFMQRLVLSPSSDSDRCLKVLLRVRDNNEVMRSSASTLPFRQNVRDFSLLPAIFQMPAGHSLFLRPEEAALL
eukprot:scaffold14453_cov72-Skeletonema_dohrnii-CCMP3373.AAC.1